MVKTEEKQGKKDQSLEAENQLLKSHVSTLEDHVTILETELETKLLKLSKLPSKE